MKLEELITLSEDTTSSSVATYNKPMSAKPLKRTETLIEEDDIDDNTCKGCNIIKQYGWKHNSHKVKQLKCYYCGKTHKRKG